MSHRGEEREENDTQAITNHVIWGEASQKRVERILLGRSIKTAEPRTQLEIYHL